MEPSQVDICIIDDDAGQRALLFERLRQQRYSVVQADNAEAGFEVIRRHQPCVVICDLNLPGMDGIELCQRIRADQNQDATYFIVVTACQDREIKHRALNNGVDDFLVKPYDGEELAARLRNGLRVAKLQQRLQHAALTDGLTGLWNHTQFRALLDREFARTRRYGGIVSMLLLDLDHFKAVNDTHGHEIGNVVLASVGQQVRRLVRDTDIVARYGGEEFTVICPETGLDDATRLAERIRETVAQHVRVPQCPHLMVTASIGVASSSDPVVHSVTDLINAADHALYIGKNSGRNRVVRCDASALAGMSAGVLTSAVDHLQKQVVALTMHAKELALQSVWALVQALEARDRFTAWHSRNTTFYAAALAEAADWSPALRSAVANAAMLHDLGKIGVPDDVLQSTAALTEPQQAILRQVPLLTCKILEPLRVFETETLIIRHLRERFDGSGYPFGLAGTTIPIGARLLVVAEAFDALVSERPYRGNLSIEEAVARIQADAGTQFDPQFVELLARAARKQQRRWKERIARALSELERSGPPVFDARLLPSPFPTHRKAE